eukprot:m.227254 g.227254  ORF g.227254 m.227254 type:complete len:992 (+) comp17162_c0_seq1:14-2989(+)
MKLALLVLALLASAGAIAVVSIDLGSEWMKIGLVKPGVPMEIVLNTESQRKTAVGVSFAKGERVFADFAVNNCVKDPVASFRYLLPLIGQQANSKVVTDFKASFPFYDIRAHPERGTVVFHTKDASYTVEELFAMILEYAVGLAAKHAEQPINSVTITVPPFFTQAQRLALLAAGKIAKINIMQLTNTNTAVAVNYGVFRRSEFNETAQNILFVDIGAGFTTATVVEYTAPKKKGSKTGTAQLEIHGMGFDPSLGGLAFEQRLATHLLALFKEKNPKLKTDPALDGRATAKFLKEAGRVKKILSANVETFAQIENAYQEIDFRALVTRAEFETMCADLFSRVLAPLDAAVAQAGLRPTDLNQVIIVGGSTRIPRVQALLQEWFGGRDLGKSINADEAAAMGAAYQIAVLSKGFRVKEFAVRDAAAYPIEIEFERTESSDGEEATGTVTRTLFHRGNLVPQKKLLSFNNKKSDFTFKAQYGDLSFLSPTVRDYVGETTLLSATVDQVAAAFDAHSQDTPKGIKAHFRLDESGIFHLDAATALFEPKPAAPSEGILGKISSLLGGESEAQKATEGEGASEKESEGAAAGETQSDKADTQTEGEGDKNEGSEKSEGEADKGEKTEGEKSEGAEKEEKKDSADATDAPTNATNTSATNSTNTTLPTPAKPKTVKVPLGVKAKTSVIEPLDTEYEAGVAKLRAFTEIEEEKKANEAAKNALEAFIYNTRDKLEQAPVIAVSTEAERTTLGEELSANGLWLEDEGFGATTAEFRTRLNALNKTARPIFFRLAESVDRPEAIARLLQTLNMTDEFVARVKLTEQNRTEDEEPWIRAAELASLVSMANETRTWLEEKQDKQNALAAHDDPVLTSSAIGLKAGKLERELLFLFRRPKPRPKPKFKASNSTTSGGKKNKTSTTNTTTPTNTTTSDEDETFRAPVNQTDKGHESEGADKQKQSKGEGEAQGETGETGEGQGDGEKKSDAGGDASTDEAKDEL